MNDLFYDRAEFLKAAASPEYRDSPRYRNEVASKLQRSMAAGRITPMGEQITTADRTQTRTAYTTGDNANGYIVPGADPAWAAAQQVTQGFFKAPEEIANAMSAPAYEIDPSYRLALVEKVQRSQREGFITADLKAADPSQPGN